MGDHVLFFYGTLMAPQVLHRVIHGRREPELWQKTMLRFQPAVLLGYRRHRVRGADYPGIVPASKATARSSVLGTLVSGLTDGDVHRLDMYEGDEYTRDPVTDVLDATEEKSKVEGDEVQAKTYVWVAGEGRLEDAEWDFETFKKDKMAWWVNADESQW
ncbi:disease resistance protein Aig2 [Penicillium maclennaniae]|uniref:disease resistance protein Aig2 n=1 Tax=Penicillium maclennaniae TaxID=1343394 RepID=UPI0025415CAA|nr:disease resistance protein Aig2 [Penicillium maclennaniae]KAJ5665214.1 disease resistance protein Aig2 [Penicillium maclennaniae]